MNTLPALLVAWLRLPKIPPLWAPDGSCIIARAFDGWVLGPETRESTHPLLTSAAKAHAYDLGDAADVEQAIKSWKDEMREKQKGLAWDVWAYQTKTRIWMRP